ncbi:heparinase II/III family protein [Psychromonas sp. 14N.309.X.WAT.B.A12]|uniref:heparinase II/III domain-containing protein n=1 Tax=unclassified Psychromonas TaxID=2614957 RepID=UPI0025B08A1D|nr:heparinase II/III family protein [Psychromonas sp. 14N.309.X.WAT.B.A12]MDN2664915.1 heparinase II/III family protein [Psychromonas sp. 14N.309.X.WAT.B.A12]
MSYQPLLMSYEQAAELRQYVDSDSLIGLSISEEIDALEAYMPIGIEIPGHGEAGGYEHNRHKQNYIHLDLAGRLYLITEDKRYLDYATTMLIEYAKVYKYRELNISRDSNKPGRLFHQTLNENMWMLYSSCAYSCIRHQLTEQQQQLIENDLFKVMLEMFVETYAENFDIIHNHGLWSVASAGICAYAINDQATVDKAIYGLKGDSVSGGFIAQLTQLFSPDGYYMEGPYYHRFSLRPIFLFAETIERRQPEIGIYQLKDEVIKTTAYAVMSTAFPNGTLPALNDSSRTMDIKDLGILLATNICFDRYEQNETLLAMAKHQGKVWVHNTGATLSNALQDNAEVPNFNWGSLSLSDGAEGECGGVTILRHRDTQADDSMALLWYGQHGSDAKLHSALDHGHFDGLHLSLFNNNQEFINDYGYGRWVNIEPKFGGRYIPENTSYCKQTIAHNTVVVDQTSQNQGTTAIAQQHFGEQHFTLLDDQKLQAMSAYARDYYPGIDQQRTVIMAELEGFEKPLIIDLFRLISEEEHSYDYPVHYQGQIIRNDFDYEANKSLNTLGDAFGYQHLWNLGQGKIEKSSLTTWLMGNTYYSLISSANENSEFIFARTGANDPDFNLRNEPLFILRQKAANHLFANVYETHGYFNEAIEASLNARGLVESVEVLHSDNKASVVMIHLSDQKQLKVCVNNQVGVNAETITSITINGEQITWTGAVSII